MTMDLKTEPPRRPTAFRLDRVEMADQADSARASGRPLIIPELDEFPPLIPAPRRGRSTHWGGILAGALGVLVALGIGLAIDGLIRDLFSRADWLGWFAVAGAGVAGIALLALVIREIGGLSRLRHITKIRDSATDAAARDDGVAARATVLDLAGLYGGRPDTARGRAALASHVNEIIDGRDLIGLCEHELMRGFDLQAKTLVLAASKRVTVVTAISPRALVDVAFVLISALRLIRQLGELYGGRPGTLGFLRLARAVVAHLAVTGGMAAGDSLVQQFLGHGIAARLSARLGEGVINGILTARIGLAAIDVCRPLPFIAEPAPRMSDIIAELTKLKDGMPEAAPIRPRPTP